MRATIAWVGAFLFAAAVTAAELKRKTVPIGGEWSLSGATVDRAKMDGKKVVQLIAKGEAKLKKGKNQFVGPWILEATAAEIEADFPGKRFVLKGPLEVRRKLPGGGGSVIESDSSETTVELAFQGENTKINGQHRMKLIDPGAEKAAKPEKEAPEEKK